MNILENYNTAKQKYGEKLVKSLSDMGIPSQYLLSACRFTTEGIGPNDIKQYFRQWMTYVKRNDGGRYDVNRMSFDEFYQTIQTFKSKYGIPNKVYDDGTVSVGKITSPSDISRFPVKNDWCIKQPNQFRKYTNQGYTFYLIDNGDESDYVRYVVLMVGKDGRKYYYDLDNSEMAPNSISEFQSHLTPNAVSFIQNLNNRQETNENRKMNKKHTIRLNESDLNRLVKETVKRVLKEEFQYKVMDDYPYKDDIELQPEGEPNGNNRRYVQVVMGGQGGTWSEFKPIYLDDKDIFVDKMGFLCTKDGRILHGTPNNDDVCKPNKPFGRFRDNEGTWL